MTSCHEALQNSRWRYAPISLAYKTHEEESLTPSLPHPVTVQQHGRGG